MTQQFFDCLADVPPEILRAYERGSYWFRVPPVCTVGWDKLAWINHVRFTDDLEILRQEKAK